MVHSILERASSGRRGPDGLPYVVIENALPEAYYRELAATFPSAERIAGSPDGDLPSNKVYRLPAREALADGKLPHIWREFIDHHCSADFFDRLRELWGREIRRAYPDFAENFGKPLDRFTVGRRRGGKRANPANRLRDVMMDCQLVVNSPVRAPSSVRGARLDSRFKLFAALLHSRDPADASEGGRPRVPPPQAGPEPPRRRGQGAGRGRRTGRPDSLPAQHPGRLPQHAAGAARGEPARGDRDPPTPRQLPR